MILSERDQSEASVTQIINKALKMLKRSLGCGWDLMPTPDGSEIYESSVGHRGGEVLMTWSPLPPSPACSQVLSSLVHHLGE